MTEKDILDRLDKIDERLADASKEMVAAFNAKDATIEWLTNRLANRDAMILKMADAIDAVYNHNETAKTAVIQHYGLLHDPFITELRERAKNK